MPVKSADTMLSSHFESIQWYETSNLDEFFDMNLLGMEPSEALFPNFDEFDSGNMDLNDLITAPSSPTSKYQIRHHDCMWSGTCVDKSHPSKKKGLSLCTAQLMQSDKAAMESTVAVKVESQKTIMTPTNIMRTIMCKSSSNNNNNINNNNSNAKLSSNGRSLLINNNNNNSNRINTNTAALTQKSQNTLNKCIDSNSKHEFDSIMNASIVNLRPDTPLSLGDDVPDLKHNIDLTPCPSSNRMKFNDPNSIKIINALAEHLEETSNSFNDPINPFMSSFRNKGSSPTDLNDILTDITLLSDYEDMNDDSSIIDMDDDDQMDEHDYKSKIFAHNLMSQASTSSMSSASSQRTTVNYEFISDHSYTRPKGSRYDPIALGVQTPSDSEEEIDVETIIEKNLPTNPSARDRRALQTTVAHKIARSKHAANQRRRVSDDDSISSSTSTLSSKGSTPIKYGSSTPQRYVSSHMITSGHSISRKRQAGHSKDSNNNVHDNQKRYRTGYNKKQKMSSRNKQIDQEELETIEKRNLHNNMERQRRIGLKNLFEQLKCHIPALKDKERAPKVNILREAATYCTKLRRDEDTYAELLKKHNRLLTRVRNLKASIAAQQRRHY
ncbi:unnamed protein product [Chironomus riparius]|uniref:BHLH domain-containing protein n=1 Tax=Chironomus riparius TaxID=315576 RepID=A0A9N9RT09_9DIPT|nr:unnamed protein product [Chironomus riparius]